jgi:hypothetical protein
MLLCLPTWLRLKSLDDERDGCWVWCGRSILRPREGCTLLSDADMLRDGGDMS